jgi:hypothetical protein
VKPRRCCQHVSSFRYARDTWRRQEPRPLGRFFDDDENAVVLLDLASVDEMLRGLLDVRNELLSEPPPLVLS